MRARAFAWAIVASAGCTLTLDLASLKARDGGHAQGDSAVDASSCGHTFCDNFDDRPLGSGWDTPVPATVELTDAAVSLPWAMRSSATLGGASNDQAFLEKRFGKVNHVQLDVDVRTFCEPTLELDLLTIAYGSCQLVFYQSQSRVHSDRSCVYDDGGVVPADAGPMGDDDRALVVLRDDAGVPYHHYTFLIDLPTNTYQVWLDRQQVALGAAAVTSAQPVTVRVGVFRQSPITNPCRAVYDNVVIDIR